MVNKRLEDFISDKYDSIVITQKDGEVVFCLGADGRMIVNDDYIAHPCKEQPSFETEGESVKYFGATAKESIIQ